MSKRNTMRTLAALSAIPFLIISSGAASASASQTASNVVSWKNAATRNCLLHNTWINRDQVSAGSCFTSNSEHNWLESQESDGSWSMVGYAMDGYWTLTSYWNNSVYLESPTANNSYQRWWEISTTTGWKLQSVATNYILDSNNSGSVYAIGDNGGNNQRWL
ncbi:RICIN domain-containing protein [Kitasatospora purpeofusca]|uniref:RICIN domain-containing protein n=1 Tax=Kitasatospora purpeofusca TaxID=67352 RepID=UPI0037F2A0D0